MGRKVVEEGGYPTVRHSVGHPIGRRCHDSAMYSAAARSPPGGLEVSIRSRFVKTSFSSRWLCGQ